MRIDDLLKKIEGPMSKEWQEAHDYVRCYESKRNRIEDQYRELGKELCDLARRKLKEICQKHGSQKWASVHMVAPGYILQHGGPVVIRKPYLQFCVSIGGNSELRYNHWPKDSADVDAVCNRIAAAIEILVRPTSNARLAH